MQKRNRYFSSHRTLSDKEVEGWIKKQQNTAGSREKALKQFEKDERLSEKKSRETVIIFGETVKQFLKRLEAIWK